MSSLYVRQTIEDYLQTQIIPFYHTINIKPEPLEQQWCTIARYTMQSRNNINFCGANQEEGEFSVGLISEPGQGDKMLVTHCETILTHFKQFKNPKLTIKNGIIQDGNNIEIRNYYALQCIFDYEYNE